MEHMVRPVIPMDVSSLSHFFSCEVSSVVRNNIVWDTKTVYLVHRWRFW